MSGSSINPFTARSGARSELIKSLREFLDKAQREPVGVLRHDRMVGVLVSAQDYEAMRAFYADRLHKTLEGSANSAQVAGLTPELLEALLVDES
jgi:PHD/YefM family antitoxin component YafN of YafNO toxin-antitoxin module